MEDARQHSATAPTQRSCGVVIQHWAKMTKEQLEECNSWDAEQWRAYGAGLAARSANKSYFLMSLGSLKRGYHLTSEALALAAKEVVPVVGNLRGIRLCLSQDVDKTESLPRTLLKWLRDEANIGMFEGAELQPYVAALGLPEDRFAKADNRTIVSALRARESHKRSIGMPVQRVVILGADEATRAWLTRGFAEDSKMSGTDIQMVRWCPAGLDQGGLLLFNVQDSAVEFSRRLLWDETTVFMVVWNPSLENSAFDAQSCHECARDVLKVCPDASLMFVSSGPRLLTPDDEESLRGWYGESFAGAYYVEKGDLDGVAKLLQDLMETAAALPAIPKVQSAFLRVKADVVAGRGSRSSVITLGEWNSLCEKAHLLDQEDFDRALSLLVDVGEVLVLPDEDTDRVILDIERFVSERLPKSSNSITGDGDDVEDGT
uniref:Uncharacterized protein n=1 Tax=Pinguiococcus pyrenoidosus TaxID=172671 RepID=A0A7R9U7G9_9STRA